MNNLKFRSDPQTIHKAWVGHMTFTQCDASFAIHVNAERPVQTQEPVTCILCLGALPWGHTT